MLFNSIHFLLFFPIIVGIYFLLPFKHRWKLLLAGSYYFYMCWKIEYIILILFSTIIDYYCSLKMDSKEHKRDKKKYLIISLITNLGILFLFKYFNFFGETTNLILQKFNIFYNVPRFNLLLPVGISFYTFQTLSYSIDVYKGKQKAEKHFGIFALYVSFFPQLVAGPIERSTHLLPQFKRETKFEYNNVRRGLLLILAGLFKKVVIADNISNYVDPVYNSVGLVQGFPLILATLFFGIQIYCDFSGYSDIAIGVAKILGYDLMKNFNLPYFSKSIKEFWGRWHISLSTWFRDYVYLELGGNRTTTMLWIRNIAAVFILSGLWHGANLTFIVWGVLHFLFYLFSHFLKPIRQKSFNVFKKFTPMWLISFYRVLFTYISVHIAWVFFRANSLNDAIYIIKNMFPVTNFNLNTQSTAVFAVYCFLILILFIFMIIREKLDIIAFLDRCPLVVRWSFYLIAPLFIIIFQGSASNFIYFQF
ncbi:MAG: membrane-bound O-acyltransferase family protein [Candidatus Cloacimonetes bacterium 4572_65]|nr:MAG: membrane-bound O-acyltransferase family protein [Candidatus Cloacimonetes bacterium 4572_65]